MLKISLSNMYFSDPLDQFHLEVLRKEGVSAIELAPFHQFHSYDDKNKLVQFRSWLVEANISISGIQGFTYAENANDLRNSFLSGGKLWKDHYRKILAIAEILECKTLVFGAPNFRSETKNKIRFGKAFMLSANMAKVSGKDLLLEAVPKCYGSNIYNTFEEVKEFNLNNNLKTHFDTGCYINEKREQDNDNFWPSAEFYHFHLSAEDLKLCAKSKSLKEYLKTFNLGSILDGYLVLESTVKSNTLSEAVLDVSFAKKVLKNAN
ncbi:sugar phosphate isomerase/epimerase [Rhodobacteraceae bacterium]|nr:sugar phosphate isomerase/epimerase [Paracoccaceae bacterium]